MSLLVTFNGITFDLDSFINYGYYTPKVEVNGTEYPPWTALLIAASLDLNKALNTTSDTEKDAGLSGTQVWTMAQEVPFALGAFVMIADASFPDTNYYIAQVTATVYDTTLTTQIVKAVGSATAIDDWVISIAGAPGETGQNGAGVPTISGGDALKYVRVNAGETAVEYVTPLTVANALDVAGMTAITKADIVDTDILLGRDVSTTANRKFTVGVLKEEILNAAIFLS